jgi:phage antirepressor YoqD-like protein
MNEPARQGDRRMTVREVAEALSIDISTVTKRVRELFPQKVKNGVTTYLDEAEVTRLKMELQHNGHLGQLSEVAAMPKTDLEKALLIRQAMQFQQEIIDNLRKENEEMKPKAAFFDQVADSKDALQIRDVAGVLNLSGYGRNTLFEFLRKKEVLDSRNIPYRKFQDHGYFRVIEQKWTDNEGETHISLKTLVYQRGVDYIRKLIQESA